MKSTCFALFLLVVLIAPVQAAKRLLFIGNSYTGVNNLPKIYQEIVTSTGISTLEVKATTPGGKTLEQHLSEAKTLQLIDEGNWDEVVLQGQSQEASLAEQSATIRASFLKGGKELCERIRAKSPKARIVFYQTWARHADAWKNTKAAGTVGENPDKMQALNHKWYQEVASQNKATVAPVGDAWQFNYQSPQAILLHKKDNSHPEFNGSYLAALVIYATLNPSASLKVPYHGKLSDSEASYLQELANRVAHPVKK